MNHRQAKKYYRSWIVTYQQPHQLYYDWCAVLDCKLTWGKLKKIGLVPNPKRWRQKALAQKDLSRALAKET